MFELEITYKTRKGRNRDLNEDNLVVVRLSDLYVLAIADGLGGHTAGEIASRLAIRELVGSAKMDTFRNGLRDAIKAAILRANMAIYDLSRENLKYRGMASTLVMAAISPGESLVANIGDSRAYLIGAEACQITRDHSLVQQMVDNQLISKEESFSHSQRNIVTMSLGRRREIQPDFYPVFLSGKTLLLCSDGLSDSLQVEEIGYIISNAPDLEECSNSLIDAASRRGATDDITVILARQEIHFRNLSSTSQIQNSGYTECVKLEGATR